MFVLASSRDLLTGWGEKRNVKCQLLHPFKILWTRCNVQMMLVFVIVHSHRLIIIYDNFVVGEFQVQRINHESV